MGWWAYSTEATPLKTGKSTFKLDIYPVQATMRFIIYTEREEPPCLKDSCDNSTFFAHLNLFTFAWFYNWSCNCTHESNYGSAKVKGVWCWNFGRCPGIQSRHSFGSSFVDALNSLLLLSVCVWCCDKVWLKLKQARMCHLISVAKCVFSPSSHSLSKCPVKLEHIVCFDTLSVK